MVSCLAVDFPITSGDSVNFFFADASDFSIKIGMSRVSSTCYGQSYTSTLQQPNGGAKIACTSVQSWQGGDLVLTCAGAPVNAFQESDSKYEFSFINGKSAATLSFFASHLRPSATTCAKSVTFPSYTPEVYYDVTDPNAIFTTFEYSPYECGFGKSYTLSGSLTGYYDDMIYSTSDMALATSDDAQWYDRSSVNAPYNDVTRGSIVDDTYDAMILVTSATTKTEMFSRFEGKITVKHDSAQGDLVAPGPSQGLRRRARLAAQNIFEETANLVCGPGYRVCRVPGSYLEECVGVEDSVDTCGGCPGADDSVDCTLIPGADSMACVMGVCQVYSCDDDFTLVNGTYCEAPAEPVGQVKPSASLFW